MKNITEKCANMTEDEYNKFVKKRMRKLKFKKVFLFTTCPFWGIFYEFYVIGKDTWNDISWWVNNRNPGPR